METVYCAFTPAELDTIAEWSINFDNCSLYWNGEFIEAGNIEYLLFDAKAHYNPNHHPIRIVDNNTGEIYYSIYDN